MQACSYIQVLERSVPIGSSARQHFVDPVDMEGVDPHPDVELVLAAVLHQVLVAADTGGLYKNIFVSGKLKEYLPAI